MNIMTEAWREAAIELGKEMNPPVPIIVMPSRVGCKSGKCGMRRPTVFNPRFIVPTIKVRPLQTPVKVTPTPKRNV